MAIMPFLSFPKTETIAFILTSFIVNFNCIVILCQAKEFIDLKYNFHKVIAKCKFLFYNKAVEAMEYGVVVARRPLTPSV